MSIVMKICRHPECPDNDCTAQVAVSEAHPDLTAVVLASLEAAAVEIDCSCPRGVMCYVDECPRPDIDRIRAIANRPHSVAAIIATSTSQKGK